MTPALDRALERLGCAQWPLEQRVRAYLALDAAVDAELFQAKARVLKSAIAWGGEGQALAAKAHETATTLASILELNELEAFEMVSSNQPWVSLAKPVSAEVAQAILMVEERYVRLHDDLRLTRSYACTRQRQR